MPDNSGSVTLRPTVKGALVRFAGDAGALRRVRECAALHPNSMRVLS
jgi:hypothetical protein